MFKVIPVDGGKEAVCFDLILKMKSICQPSYTFVLIENVKCKVYTDRPPEGA